MNQSLLLITMLILLVSCKKADKDLSTSVQPRSTDTNTMEGLNFQDSLDFINARRGFIASIEDGLIKNKKGDVVRDLKDWDFLKSSAPNTANPSLWRQGQLNRIHGLFEVTQGIYQIRGFDLANMTVIATESGWILIDPLTSPDASRAGMALINQHLGKKPIKAIIYTHSHIDHFGGIRGVVSEADITSGKIPLIAPEGFFEHSISENIIAGNAMFRRAMYMYGILLKPSETGMIGSGLGQATTSGDYGIIRPNHTIRTTGEKMVIDGVELIFQNTPGAEAPSEMMFYIPKYKAFCQSEEINHTLHNLYTLRGAQVRNGLKWAKYIDNTIVQYGDKAEISFGSHHWPTWGNEEILKFWTGQRNTYKYIHDRTLYLANNGYNMTEIAEMISLPTSTASSFANRDYYGSVSHNSKAQYQLYYGWFDGNPANLNPLPSQAAAKKYIQYMGGADQVLEKAQQDYDNGSYRWVAEVLNHLVFAQPQSQAARNLLADTYTQMAYQTENGPWRNFYLTGAQELRYGVDKKLIASRSVAASTDILTNMPIDVFYDYLAVKLDSEKAKGKNYTFNLIFPDTKQKISLYLEDQILYNRLGVLAEHPNATITMNKTVFNEVITGRASGKKKALLGEIKISGSRSDYQDFQSLISQPFNPTFNIIEP